MRFGPNGFRGDTYENKTHKKVIKLLTTKTFLTPSTGSVPWSKPGQDKLEMREGFNSYALVELTVQVSQSRGQEQAQNGGNNHPSSVSIINWAKSLASLVRGQVDGQAGNQGYPNGQPLKSAERYNFMQQKSYQQEQQSHQKW